jgi:hypothetical protein
MCDSYDGANTWQFGFFPDGNYVVTNNPAFASLAASACQSGNLVAVHVYSLNPFLWQMMAAYPFK